MDLNKAQIIGRMTSDIELRTTPNGQNVTSFSVATNRSWVDGSGMKQEQAEFHNVVLWGKLAEIASQYLQKGKRVFIEGRLQTRAWDAQDGSKRYKTEIIGENMIMLDSRDSGSSDGSSSPSFENQTPAIKKTSPKAEEEISIEDIPF
nr:single-stranded DNA-binding protein [Candidatus Gracilibacteria bacterium]